MPWKTMDVQEQRVQFVVAASRREASLPGCLCQLGNDPNRLLLTDLSHPRTQRGDRAINNCESAEKELQFSRYPKRPVGSE
jgi:hypothetical protein